MSSFRKLPGLEGSSSLKLNRPVVERLAHFRFIGRIWISLALTPIRFAQDWTSSLNVFREMVRVRRDRWLSVVFAWLARSIYCVALRSILMIPWAILTTVSFKPASMKLYTATSEPLVPGGCWSASGGVARTPFRQPRRPVPPWRCPLLKKPIDSKSLWESFVSSRCLRASRTSAMSLSSS